VWLALEKVLRRGGLAPRLRLSSGSCSLVASQISFRLVAREVPVEQCSDMTCAGELSDVGTGFLGKSVEKSPGNPLDNLPQNAVGYFRLSRLLGFCFHTPVNTGEPTPRPVYFAVSFLACQCGMLIRRGASGAIMKF
jgi:hypothetical protein